MSSPSREPPSGPPWDTPLGAAPLAFVDLEMTGLDAARHHVIEVCVHREVGGAVVGRLETFVRPDPLTDTIGNQHIHGIDHASLVSAPPFRDVFPRVQELLGDAILVAHGARWDVSFLHAEFDRVGAPFVLTHWLDTLALSRRSIRADNHRLATLAAELGIQSDNPHRAGNDAAVTRQLFHHLVSLLDPGERRTATPRMLWQRSHGRGVVLPNVLDAAEAAIGPGQPLAVHYRSAASGPQRLDFVVTEVRRDLDPPRVLGYLHRTRGRRELRADRILSLQPVAK